MNFLHTSDWHLGHTLYSRNRYSEFSAFLDWLVELMKQERIDALLVAGDLFDTTMPGNRAQELYYGFLHRVARSTPCRHVVITSGNHDSASFLDAPKALLRALDVHVIGSVSDNVSEEVVALHDRQGGLEAVVCAVPHLRDRDIRSVVAGESVDDKSRKLIEGIELHYQKVCKAGELLRQQEGASVPMIAMGHLFTAGGITTDGDGVRELYIGSLARVSRSIFPTGIDYLALGHLHIPQRVGCEEHLRYSGSPLPMGFGEARQQKQVLFVEFADGERRIREIAVPRFQPLERISGDVDAITSRMLQLQAEGSSAWLEIEYTGAELAGNLGALLEEAVEGTKLEICRIKNRRTAALAMQQLSEYESLDELGVLDVFERCLTAAKVPDTQRSALLKAYQEIVLSLHENDEPLSTTTPFQRQPL